MDNKEVIKKIDYEDMAKKLLRALANELRNLGYVDEKSLQRYFEENVGLDKQQIKQAIKWSRYS